MDEGMIAYLRNRANGGISVHPWMGKWRVRWRDFGTTSQEREFETEVKALEYGRKIRFSDIQIELDEMHCDDISQASEFWKKYG